jgi:hypothetical protein
MSYYSDQASQFKQMASDLESRLTNEGSTLDDATYTGLAAKRDALLDQSAAMIAADLKGVLDQLKVDQTRLAQCTATLNVAVKTLKDFDQIAAIVAAAVTLATAIASANPSAILSAVAGAEKAVVAALPKPEKPSKPSTAACLAGDLLAIAASQDPDDPAS